MRLYRSRREFATAAGLGKRTIDKLETGQSVAYRPQTVDSIEAALGWEAGSVEAVLGGGSPEPIADPYLRRISEAWPRLSEDVRSMLADLADRHRGQVSMPPSDL